MKKVLLSALILFFLAACNKKEKAAETTNFDAKFDNYKKEFVSHLWEVYPEWASNQGYHKRDSVLVVTDSMYLKRQLDFAHSQLDSIQKYPLDNLSDANIIDYYIIKNQLKGIVFNVDELKSYQWNPSEYNVCGSFAEILNGKYDTAEARLHNFNLKMNGITAYYEAAKKNIQNPTLEHTALAISQNLGGVSVFQKDLNYALSKSKLAPTEKKEIQTKAKIAVSTIVAYTDWLKKLDNKTPRSFRLGAALYKEKFELEIQSNYKADTIFKKAVAHKKELHAKMFILADKLWDKYNKGDIKPIDSLSLIKKVIDKISLQHTTPTKFQLAIENKSQNWSLLLKKKICFILIHQSHW